MVSLIFDGRTFVNLSHYCPTVPIVLRPWWDGTAHVDHKTAMALVTPRLFPFT